MGVRQHRTLWPSICEAALLLFGLLALSGRAAGDELHLGHRAPRAHQHADDAASDLGPEAARELHGREVLQDAAVNEDATHRLTAGGMHPKKGARAATPVREHHHVTHRSAGGGLEDGSGGGRHACRAADVFSQNGNLTGDWVPHADPKWRGEYVQHTQCPTFAEDFNCAIGMGEEWHRNKELLEVELNKIFRPHKCDLQPFSEAGFDRCLAGGRRLIMIGDSTMNGIFNSLACLLRSRLATGHLEPWERSEVTDIRGDYTSRSGDIYLQVTGDMKLKGGGDIILRSFGRFNITLWDRVMGELEPVTDRDIILVNFGAWYHRFFFDGGPDEFKAWRDDVHELLFERLRHYPAQVIWKGYTTFHYGGETGAFTGIQQELSNTARFPPLQACQATTVGEYWFDEEMGKFLKQCGEPCAKIGILPLFEASKPLHNMHHGTYGRGMEQNEIDCTHYCSHARDVWATLLYTYMCA